MGHKYTDGACIKKLMDRAREHGFSPFLVRKQSMGYIYNRSVAASHERLIFKHLDS